MRKKRLSSLALLMMVAGCSVNPLGRICIGVDQQVGETNGRQETQEIITREIKESVQEDSRNAP